VDSHRTIYSPVYISRCSLIEAKYTGHRQDQIGKRLSESLPARMSFVPSSKERKAPRSVAAGRRARKENLAMVGKSSKFKVSVRVDHRLVLAFLAVLVTVLLLLK
jgi:hypothetical protein